MKYFLAVLAALLGVALPPGEAYPAGSIATVPVAIVSPSPLPVSVANIPTVSVSGTPTVAISGTPGVSISPLPTTSPIPVYPVPASSGSASQNTAVGSSVAVTFPAPANTISALVQAPSSNTANVHCTQGATATTSGPMLFEPGRSESYPNSSNISCIAESGTQTVSVLWSMK